MRSHLVLIFGLLLSSSLRIEAQTTAAQVFLVQARSEPTTMFVRASPAYFPSKVSLTSFLPWTPVAQFTKIPAYKPDIGIESRLQMEVVKTLFVTESRLAIVKFWRGRLHLDGFDSTLHTQNMQLGPSGSDGLPPSHDQAAVARSVGLDGISLSFRLGRDEQTGSQSQVWRCLAWIRGESRGCPL
jgi:hypothetical protein